MEQARPVVVGLVAPGRQNIQIALILVALRSHHPRDPLVPQLAKATLRTLDGLGLNKQDVSRFPDARVEVAQPLLVLFDLVREREKVDEWL